MPHGSDGKINLTGPVEIPEVQAPPATPTVATVNGMVLVPVEPESQRVSIIKTMKQEKAKVPWKEMTNKQKFSHVVKTALLIGGAALVVAYFVAAIGAIIAGVVSLGTGLGAPIGAPLIVGGIIALCAPIALCKA